MDALARNGSFLLATSAAARRLFYEPGVESVLGGGAVGPRAQRRGRGGQVHVLRTATCDAKPVT
jgi:hypothetical protein